MSNFFTTLQSYFPHELNWETILWFLVLSAAGSLLLGVFGRIVLGKRSGLNHAVSSAMGILFIYVITIVIYTFNPANLSRFLSPLPYVRFEQETLHLFAFQSATWDQISYQLLSMLILAFLVNLLDTFFPKGKGIISWYLYRFLTMILAMGLHFVIHLLVNTFLPGVLVSYATAILLCILAGCLLLGIAKVILGLIITITNPLLGGIYAFFFSNIVGKQISKAFITTTLLTVLMYVIEHFGYLAITITSSVLPMYVPLLVAFLLLWYLLGHIL